LVCKKVVSQLPNEFNFVAIIHHEFSTQVLLHAGELHCKGALGKVTPAPSA